MTDPTPAEALKANYEARLCPGIPTDCCDYGVISHATGKEVCRVWNEEDARRIADLLNAALPSPATNAGEVREKVVADRLLYSAKILYENALGCLHLHHGRNPTVSDLPGWLADCRRDIEAADDPFPQASSQAFADGIEAAAKVAAAQYADSAWASEYRNASLVIAAAIRGLAR